MSSGPPHRQPGLNPLSAGHPAKPHRRSRHLRKCQAAGNPGTHTARPDPEQARRRVKAREAMERRRETRGRRSPRPVSPCPTNPREPGRHIRLADGSTSGHERAPPQKTDAREMARNMENRREMSRSRDQHTVLPCCGHERDPPQKTDAREVARDPEFPAANLEIRGV